MNVSPGTASGPDRRTTAADLLLLALAVLLSLSLFHAPGTGDVEVWRRWMIGLSEHGLVEGYRANAADYPPGCSAILLAVTRTAEAFHAKRFLVLKLSLLVALWLTAAVVWLWSRKVRYAAVMAFALTLSSVGHVYLDVYFAPTLLAALWALSARRYALFAVAFNLTCLIKWQPVLIAPFVVIHLLGELRGLPTQERRRALIALVLPTVLLWGGAFAVFGWEILMAWNRVIIHRSLSGNALNLHWVLTDALQRWRPEAYGGLIAGRVPDIVGDEGWLFLGPRLLFVASYVLLVALSWKRRGRLLDFLACALLGTLAHFMLNGGVHENHLFPAVILAAVLAALAPGQRMTFALWAIAANLNLFIFYGAFGPEPPISRVVGVDVALPAALVNLALFAWTWKAVLRPA